MYSVKSMHGFIFFHQNKVLLIIFIIFQMLKEKKGNSGEQFSTQKNCPLKMKMK